MELNIFVNNLDKSSNFPVQAYLGDIVGLAQDSRN